jgi:hypothetical protein
MFRAQNLRSSYGDNSPFDEGGIGGIVRHGGAPARRAAISPQPVVKSPGLAHMKGTFCSDLALSELTGVSGTVGYH